MVDLSDVRSMSRPGSPRSVFPSPCIIEPCTGRRAPGRRKQWRFGVENANVRSGECRSERERPWTPGTELQGWHAEDTNKWLIHPILVPHPTPPSLPPHCLYLSVCRFFFFFAMMHTIFIPSACVCPSILPAHKIWDYQGCVQTAGISDSNQIWSQIQFLGMIVHTVFSKCPMGSGSIQTWWHYQSIRQFAVARTLEWRGVIQHDIPSLQQTVVTTFWTVQVFNDDTFPSVKDNRTNWKCEESIRRTWSTDLIL